MQGLTRGKHWCYSKVTMLKNLPLSPRESQALKLIRSWFLRKGRGPSVRELTHAMGFGSTRTAVILLNNLIDKKVLERRDDGSLRIKKNLPEDSSNARTVEVPLVGIVACGAPIFAEENIEAYFPVSVSLAKSDSPHFLLRASGDSMNQAGINDGDLVLVRQQNHAVNKQRVVALIDNEATVKEIEFATDAVILRPRSTNKNHQPIILERNFEIQGVVVATLPKETFKIK